MESSRTGGVPPDFDLSGMEGQLVRIVEFGVDEIRVGFDAIWLSVYDAYAYRDCQDAPEKLGRASDRSASLLELPGDVVRSAESRADGDLVLHFESGRTFRALGEERTARTYELSSTSACTIEPSQLERSTYSYGFPDDFDFDALRGQTLCRVGFWTNQVTLTFLDGMVIYLRERYLHRRTVQDPGEEWDVPDPRSSLMELAGEILASVEYQRGEPLCLRFGRGLSVFLLHGERGPESGALQVPKPGGGDHQYVL